MHTIAIHEAVMKLRGTLSRGQGYIDVNQRVGQFFSVNFFSIYKEIGVSPTVIVLVGSSVQCK